MKDKGNPMHWAMHLSPRCGAKTRSTELCRAPAMPNGRCRMHGGASPGAPKGERNGMFKHGQFTNEAIAERAELSALIKEVRKTTHDLSYVEDHGPALNTSGKLRDYI